MKLPPLSIIEEERKKQGLSQTDLAKKAGVSQSLIARVESGTVDPRYSKIQALLKALEKEKDQEVNAKKIMTKNVKGVEAWENVEKATNDMKKMNISQMPVYEDGKIIGSISEKRILDEIAKGVNTNNLSKQEVLEIMEPEFPGIAPETPASVISNLLEHNKAIVVKEKGVALGIITNTDFLKIVTNQKK